MKGILMVLDVWSRASSKLGEVESFPSLLTKPCLYVRFFSLALSLETESRELGGSIGTKPAAVLKVCISEV